MREGDGNMNDIDKWIEAIQELRSSDTRAALGKRA